MGMTTSSSITGANLVSCGGVGYIRFWNVRAGTLLGEFQGHNDGIFSYIFCLFS